MSWCVIPANLSLSLHFAGFKVAAPRLHVWALAIDCLFLTLICSCAHYIPGNDIIAMTQIKVCFNLGNTRLAAYANESSGHTTACGCVFRVHYFCSILPFLYYSLWHCDWDLYFFRFLVGYGQMKLCAYKMRHVYDETFLLNSCSHNSWRNKRKFIG